jgi:hypothetical protein
MNVVESGSRIQASAMVSLTRTVTCRYISGLLLGLERSDSDCPPGRLSRG